MSPATLAVVLGAALYLLPTLAYVGGCVVRK